MSRFWLGATLLAMWVFMAGCSPQYDWRMVTVGDGRVRAMLPAKPQSAERDLEFEGHGMTFVLTSASVEGVSFTVGYAELPDALRTDVAARERLVRQTMVSLYRNLGVAPSDMLPSPGKRFAITGTSPGRDAPLALEAVVWATPEALIEGVVIGAADTLPQAEITEFLRELAPDQRLR